MQSDAKPASLKGSQEKVAQPKSQKERAKDRQKTIPMTGGDESKKESSEDRRERLTKEAEERNAKKQEKQRTICTIDIKPLEVLSDEDLMALWKKVTTTVTQDGLIWSEKCVLEPVAFGIKKIVCSFTMGMNNSSDDVVDAIQAMEDDVQSAEIRSMNVI